MRPHLVRRVLQSLHPGQEVGVVLVVDLGAAVAEKLRHDGVRGPSRECVSARVCLKLYAVMRGRPSLRRILKSQERRFSRVAADKPPASATRIPRIFLLMATVEGLSPASTTSR